MLRGLYSFFRLSKVPEASRIVVVFLTTKYISESARMPAGRSFRLRGFLSVAENGEDSTGQSIVWTSKE